MDYSKFKQCACCGTHYRPLKRVCTEVCKTKAIWLPADPKWVAEQVADDARMHALFKELAAKHNLDL